MATKTNIEGSCYSCSYPIAAPHGAEISCPMCGSLNQAISPAISDVTLPTWLIVGITAFAAGMILGPAVLASTDAGSAFLEKQVRERLK